MTLHTYAQMDQGSEEWHDIRRGLVTASVVGGLITVGSPDATSVACEACSAPEGSPCLSRGRKVPTPIKGYHFSREQAVAKLPPVYEVANNDTSKALTLLLVAERIAGWTDPTYFNADMYRGVESEPLAVEKYAEHYKADVSTVGFQTRDDWGYVIGYSPDALVSDDGLLEVKAPRSKAHIATILADKVPERHMAQLQCGLLVSGRKWIDFISYCGGLPMWTKRVYPDPAWFKAIVAAVAQFELTAGEMVDRYLQATEGLPPTERLDNNLGLVF